MQKAKKINLLNNKFFQYAIAFLYAVSFIAGYNQVIAGYFGYLGGSKIDGRENNYGLLIFTIFAIIFPIFFFRGVVKISSFLCIFIYYFLFVPTIVTYFLGMEGSVSHVIFQQTLFVFGMTLLFLADRVPSSRTLSLPSYLNIFKVALVVTLLLTVAITFVFKDNLKLVSFDDIYKLRAENEVFNSNFFISYSLAFLINAFVPLCMSYGLFAQKKMYFIAGTVGAVIIYMAIGSKYAILLPLIVYLMFKLLRKRDLKNSFNFIGLGLVILMVFSLQFEFNLYQTILWYRTLGIAGILNNLYYNFFLNNPHTYYTHVNFVNAITGGYPYSESLGEVVGRAYFGESNANANFWAVDGYAAMGDFGIIFSSVLLFMFFVFLNKALSRFNLLFLLLCLLSYIISVTNSSLFQSILSGGALVIVIFLMFSKSKNNESILK